MHNFYNESYLNSKVNDKTSKTQNEKLAENFKR